MTHAIKGCIHLIYDTAQITGAELALVGNDGACWERVDPMGEFQLVQFCKRRGRMYGADICSCETRAGCSDFEAGIHIISEGDTSNDRTD